MGLTNFGTPPAKIDKFLNPSYASFWDSEGQIWIQRTNLFLDLVIFTSFGI